VMCGLFFHMCWFGMVHMCMDLMTSKSLCVGGSKFLTPVLVCGVMRLFMNLC